MRKAFLGIILMWYAVLTHAQIENIDRQTVLVPDIPGFQTLKCDFHLHTVFSDGTVWPTVRVTEAWELGYDAIAITDHIEGKPHRQYVPIDYNAPNEIAQQEGTIKDIIVIGGVEITRAMPPGHLNAIFIQDANKIVTERVRNRFKQFKEITGDYAYVDSIDRAHQDYLEAIASVQNQRGFVFWNHPGPPGKYDTLNIYDEHLDLIKRGLLHGIEVGNWGTYWPEAFQWCLDYNLTMVSNSDFHQPHAISTKSSRSSRRNVTLVFAKERNAESIREALIDRRSVVWVNDLIVGRQELVEPLFYNAIELAKPHYLDARRRKYVKVTNKSDIPIEIDMKGGQVSGYFDDLILQPRSSQILIYETGADEISGVVRNFLVKPGEGLKVVLKPGT